MAAVAGVTLATLQPQLAHATGFHDSSVDSPGSGRRLPVAIPRTSSAVRDSIASLMPAGLLGRLEWRWAHTSGASLIADGVQLHARYTASPKGVAIATTTGIRSNAAVVELLPYAVLVHQGKARRAGVRRLDLAGMSKHGVRAQFPFSTTGGAPENSWMLPALTSVVGLVNEGDSRDREIDGLTSVVSSQLRALELRPSIGTDSLAAYHQLLDPGSGVVAIYGSPLLLQAARTERGGASGAVSVVSLQEFLQIPHPNYFASSMLQVGDRSDPALAVPVMAALQQPAVTELLTTRARYEISGVVDSSSLLATHKPGYYSAMPELAYLTDGGLLAGMIASIHAAFLWNGGAKNDLEVARYAVSQARARVSMQKALNVPLAA